jgi:hypothetical protein
MTLIKFIYLCLLVYFFLIISKNLKIFVDRSLVYFKEDIFFPNYFPIHNFQHSKMFPFNRGAYHYIDFKLDSTRNLLFIVMEVIPSTPIKAAVYPIRHLRSICIISRDILDTMCKHFSYKSTKYRRRWQYRNYSQLR